MDNYLLYPGTSRRPGLSADLRPGLTLVLGANGLGKTTLVTLLYRMCSGPWELRGSPRADLGGRSLDVVQLTSGRRMFANRVMDGAKSAIARLQMEVGGQRVQITRHLADLSLVGATFDDIDIGGDERAFQERIVEAAGLPTFSDWLLVLKYLVFYFEDRRALVWDPTAQRQLIRLLFFSKDRAAEWRDRERAIQRLDSNMRNLQAVTSKQERQLAQDEAASASAPAARAELEALAALQEQDESRLEAETDRLLSVDAERQESRLSALTAEQDHDAAFRNLERLQLDVIDAAFPSGDETAKYLLAQLFADDECLTCGQQSSASAAGLRARIHDGRCVICGNTITPEGPKSIGPRVLARARTALQTAADRLAATAQRRDEDEAGYASVETSVQALTAAVATRRARMDSLIRQLPPEEAEIHARRSDLLSMRAQVEGMKAELDAMRTDFASFISAVTEEMAALAAQVKDTFEQYAGGFLLDSATLVWAPSGDTVGESGRQIPYPNFEVLLANASFPSPIRRSGPNQVSESPARVHRPGVSDDAHDRGDHTRGGITRD